MKQSGEESHPKSIQGDNYKSDDGLQLHAHGTLEHTEPANSIAQRTEELNARTITRPIPFPKLTTTSSLGKRKEMASCTEPGEDIEDLLIHVPGVSSKAYISRQMMLSEITKNLGLAIHSTGTMHESPLQIRGWVEIDVLPTEENLFAKKKKFYGETAHTMDRALENACETAITNLMTKCRVQIDDANFNHSAVLQKKLHAATNFENMFKESEEVRIKYMASLKESNEKILEQVHHICVNSVGFLPIKISPSTANQSCSIKVEYDGPIPATDQKEKLAASLAALASTKVIAGLLTEDGKD